MNPHLARFLAVLAALLAYMAGHAVGYLRASREQTMLAIVGMLETRAELDRRTSRAALISLDAALESQGQVLEVAQKRSASDMVEYGILGFCPLDQDKDGLEEKLTRRLSRQNTPPPAIVLKTAGENVPFWSQVGTKSGNFDEESRTDRGVHSDDAIPLPQGFHPR